MTKQRVLGCLGYIVVGFLLMFPLDIVFETMKWPLFNGWALAHGSFILAWPLLTLLSFAVHSMIRKQNPK